nr:hypothetical protein Iba_scaffold6383CG0050 [Ipomoea batatas]
MSTTLLTLMRTATIPTAAASILSRSMLLCVTLVVVLRLSSHVTGMQLLRSHLPASSMNRSFNAIGELCPRSRQPTYATLN